MQEIDVSTWKRREHFEFFRRMDLPFYNVNLNVDITGLPEFSKSHALSLNGLLIHLTVSALNRTENFRYRLREDTVVLHDKLHPSFAPSQEWGRTVSHDHGRFLRRPFRI